MITVICYLFKKLFSPLNSTRWNAQHCTKTQWQAIPTVLEIQSMCNSTPSKTTVTARMIEPGPASSCLCLQHSLSKKRSSTILTTAPPQQHELKQKALVLPPCPFLRSVPFFPDILQVQLGSGGKEEEAGAAGQLAQGSSEGGRWERKGHYSRGALWEQGKSSTSAPYWAPSAPQEKVHKGRASTPPWNWLNKVKSYKITGVKSPIYKGLLC